MTGINFPPRGILRAEKKEAVILVKGISRQAVVVRSPESGAFEQAIFLLSEDRSGAALHSPEELLALADKLAARCGAVPAGVRHRLRPDLWHGLCFVLGAALTGGVWLLTALLR